MTPTMLFVMLAAVAQPNAEPEQGWDAYETLLWSSVAADLVTTEFSLSSGNVEVGSFVVQDRESRIVANIIQAAFVQWMYRKFGRRKWIILIPTAAHFSAAGWNINVTVSF